MRDVLQQALKAGIAAVEPQTAVLTHLQRQGQSLKIADRTYPTSDLRLISVGKAAIPMAQAVRTLIGDSLGERLPSPLGDAARTARSSVGLTTSSLLLSETLRVPLGRPQDLRQAQGSAGHRRQRLPRALIISPEPPIDLPAGWQQIRGAHPLPDLGSLEAGTAAIELLDRTTAETVILVCVSGGATALLIAPPSDIPLETLRAVYRALLASGSNIQAMNAVRSRLDRLKAGGLVTLAQPAQVVGLILSDVVGDPIGTIGSGLTAAPAAHNYLVGNNLQACQGAAAYLQTQGYNVRIVTHKLEGEAKVVGVRIAQEIQQTPPGTALIYGGETTVTLGTQAIGQGGRNQELVLAAAVELATAAQPIAVAAMGTDGVDGSSPAAGAIADHQTLSRSQQLGLVAQDYLERHDSYRFFASLGDALITGATGTNVADLAIAIHP
jgi:glycerate 2-kinase